MPVALRELKMSLFIFWFNNMSQVKSPLSWYLLLHQHSALWALHSGPGLWCYQPVQIPAAVIIWSLEAPAVSLPHASLCFSFLVDLWPPLKFDPWTLLLSTGFITNTKQLLRNLWEPNGASTLAVLGPFFFSVHCDLLACVFFGILNNCV